MKTAMKNCPDLEALSAYADNEGGLGNAQIESHLEHCVACRDAVAEIGAVDSALRREARSVAAPPALLAWIDRRRTLDRERLQGRRRRAPMLSRRAALVGAAAVAAGAAAAVFAPTRFSGNGQMAPTIFRDFATRVAADRALDYPHAEFHNVAEWFDARLPFLAPRLPALEHIALRGGRLCWLLDRRIAAVHFEHADQETCFYVAQAHGLTLRADRPLPGPSAPPALLSASGAAGAFWRDASLAYAVVGAQPLAAISALAGTLRGDL